MSEVQSLADYNAFAAKELLVVPRTGESDPSKLSRWSKEIAVFTCSVCEARNEIKVCVRAAHTKGCEQCAERGFRSLRDINLRFAMEFERANPGCLAIDVDMQDRKKKHKLQCKQDHEPYYLTIAEMEQGKRCVKCTKKRSAKKVVSSVAAMLPIEIVAEFKSTKQGITDPAEVSIHSRESVEWECSICEASFNKTPESRYLRPTLGCSECVDRGYVTLASRKKIAVEYEKANPGKYAAHIDLAINQELLFHMAGKEKPEYFWLHDRLKGTWNTSRSSPTKAVSKKKKSTLPLRSIRYLPKRIADEFLHTKSGIKDPRWVAIASKVLAVWCCSVCGNIYERTVISRYLNQNLGCKECKKSGKQLLTQHQYAASEYERANPGRYAVDVDITKKGMLKFQCCYEHAPYYTTAAKRMSGEVYCKICKVNQLEIAKVRVEKLYGIKKEDECSEEVQSLMNQEKDTSEKPMTAEQIMADYNQELEKRRKENKKKSEKVAKKEKLNIPRKENQWKW